MSTRKIVQTPRGGHIDIHTDTIGDPDRVEVYYCRGVGIHVCAAPARYIGQREPGRGRRIAWEDVRTYWVDRGRLRPFVRVYVGIYGGAHTHLRVLPTENDRVIWLHPPLPDTQLTA